MESDCRTDLLDMLDLIQVVTTTEQKADAERIGRALVERRLAACVQIGGPIESFYWWKDQLESADEWLCTIKTRHDLYAKVESAIRKLHPYDEPEILAVPVIAASAGYIQWLNAQLIGGEE